MVVASSGDVPISPTGMDSDHCDNRATDGSQITQRFVSQSRAVRFSEPAVRYSEVLVFLWMSCRSTKNLGMVVHCGLHCPGRKARRACEEKRCCASAHLVPVRRRRVAKDDRVLLNLDRLHLCKQRAPFCVSTASLFQVNVAKGTKRGSRRGQKQNWLKFSTVSSRVAGCQQRNSDWGGVKVIIPSRCPGCERIVSGCWRRTVHVVLPSDGEHISQLHATQLRVDGCDNNGQTQPSEERHSLGSG